LKNEVRGTKDTLNRVICELMIDTHEHELKVFSIKDMGCMAENKTEYSGRKR
jgi:hypothetical protein